MMENICLRSAGHLKYHDRHFPQILYKTKVLVLGELSVLNDFNYVLPKPSVQTKFEERYRIQWIFDLYYNYPT